MEFLWLHRFPILACISAIQTGQLRRITNYGSRVSSTGKEKIERQTFTQELYFSASSVFDTKFKPRQPFCCRSKGFLQMFKKYRLLWLDAGIILRRAQAVTAVGIMHLAYERTPMEQVFMNRDYLKFVANGDKVDSQPPRLQVTNERRWIGYLMVGLQPATYP